MEKPVKPVNPAKRPIGLTTLFWKYLLTAGGSIAIEALLWWAVLMLLVRTGFVLPAAYAAARAEETAKILTEDFSPEHIPHYYRWAVFDANGNTIDCGNMANNRRLEYARQSFLLGGAGARSFPYDQYHKIVPLKQGGACVLQYDYSSPYASPALNNILPDFQLCAIAVLIGLWLLSAGLCTRHYTSLLRRDAQTLSAAVRTIAGRQLDRPLNGAANVRELGEALDAMELLRQSLAEALERQWAMEQQRRRELAALTHDLKTPLTIISGNGELLAEETLSETQRGNVDAILRGAERLTDYAGRLRAFSAGDGGEEQAEYVALTELFQVWQAAGKDLCGPKSVRFFAPEPPPIMLYVRREMMGRAVLNLLDNAVRYAGKGGEVVLSVRIEGEIAAVMVTDTGPGFSPEALVRAGRGLYTSAASRPQDGHIGWGLCYARQAAREHGGELKLWNTEDGAAAELRWPCKG